MSVQTLAGEAYGWFETATRDNGDRFDRTKDGAPEWIRDLCMEAHGDMLPDDYRYAMIRSALECISEADDPEDAAHEWADAEVSVYNAARAAWLASHLDRGGYCDEAISQFGTPDGYDDGVYGIIAQGWYMEASEVYGLVLRFLEEKDDGEEDEDEDEDEGGPRSVYDICDPAWTPR